ncbi:helix-turn-helix domain-containing protein [Luteibacter sp. NPDC031894]|uniref:helix-turn-helix domain-containing protein n=1 Tax=Luteibacter sp. NPDC031894 TaxID=3390572 RepID=UPI003D046150
MESPTPTARLGKAIRRHRQALGMSQDAFADGIEMHRAYFGAIERGSKNVTIATLIRVAEGLGVSMSDLMRDAKL